jgi:hypothetical protein
MTTGKFVQAGKAEPLPFDHVVLDEPNGERRMRAEEFFELPLSVRISHVIARRVRFFRRGFEVDRQAALAEIRQRRAAG